MRNAELTRTMNLPPAFPVEVMPEDLYTADEMRMLKDWLKATLRCRGPEEFDRAVKAWSPESRAEVARMLDELRQRGFYPDHIDGHGGIAWGIRQRGRVEIEMMRNESHYLAVGGEIERNGRMPLVHVFG